MITNRIKRGPSSTLPNGAQGEALFTTDTYDLYIGKGDGTNQRFQKYITSGTASQFIKGDGSLDSTAYLPLSGGTLTGNLLLPANNTVGGTNYYIGQTMATNDSWKIFGNSVASDQGELVFQLDDNAGPLSPNGQRFRFYYNNSNSGTAKNALIIDYNSSIFATDLTANKFVKSGGLSTEFLKADGSVDSTVITGTGTANQVSYFTGTNAISGSTFLTLNLTADNGYLILTGGATYKNADIWLNRYSNAWENAIRFQTNGTTDWYLGSSATGANSDLEFYNYGTSTNGLKLAKATNNATFGGTITATISALATAATSFVVNDSGTLKSRTAAQVLTDIGAQPLITAGTTLQYYRGDKTFQTLNTSVVPESGSIYFTEPRVLATVLTGLNLSGGGTIAATDSVLTAFGKVQNQISAMVGGVIYQGTWNASTNTPTLTSSVGTKGYYYIVSVAGSTNLNGITDWKIGDWAIFNGTTWDKVDNTDAVSSVNGFTGAVNLGLGNISDVTLSSPTNGQILKYNGTSSKWENVAGTTTNISEGTNLYYTDARARAAITLTTTGASGASTYNSTTGALNIPQYTFNGLSPMTTLGDIIYGSASGAGTRLAGNTTAVKQYLSQTGTGSASAAPSWATIAGSDITGAALTEVDDTNVTLTLGGTPSTALLRAVSLTLGWTGQLAISRGGTGASTKAAAFDALSPMTTLGDVVYGGASGTGTRLAGNTTTTKQYLSQTGTGTASAAPAWATIAGSDITGAALTKTDDTNVTLTLGGTPATALLRAASLTLGWTGQLSVARGGTGAASFTAGQILYGNGTSAINSSANLFWDNTNVELGIGTNGPESTLHISKSNAGGLGGQLTIDNPAASTVGNTVEISFLTDAGASGTGNRNARILVVNENAANGAANMQFHTWNGTASAERVRITSGGNVIIGNGDSNATPALGVIRGTNGTGTNIAGAEFRIAGGIGTGTGVGGAITFYTAAAGTTGSTLNTSVERMQINSAGTIRFNAYTTNGLLYVSGGTGTISSAARTINGTTFDGSANITITANTTNAITFNNGGAGAASGTTFNGSAARTISYNTIGAQPLLTNPITGDGTEAAGNIAYFTGNTSIAGNASLFWDTTNSRLGVGTNTPNLTIDARGNAAIGGGATASTIGHTLDANARYLTVGGSGANPNYGVVWVVNNTTEATGQSLGSYMFGQSVSSKTGTNAGTKAAITAVSSGSGGTVGGFGGELRFATRPDNAANDIGTYTRLTIASTGAATFSSSVTANGLLTINASTGNNDLRFLATTRPSIYVDSSNIGLQVRSNGTGTLQLNADNSSTGDVNINSGVLYVDASTSRVGIGTTGPSEKLEVSGSVAAAGNFTGLKLTNGSDGGLRILFSNAVAAELASITAGVTSTGAGTDDGTLIFRTSSNAVAGDRLTISSTGAATFSSSVTAASEFQALNAYGFKSYIGSSATGNNIVFTASYYVGWDGIYQSSGSTNDFGIWTNGGTNTQAKFVIKNGGNVGIGTSSPNRLLSLGSSFGASAGLSSSIKLAVFDNGTSGDTYGLGVSSNMLEIQSAENIGFYNGTGTTRTERMRITSGGELLINTTSDAGDYKLQVNGNIYTAGGGDLVLSPAVSGSNVILYNDTGGLMVNSSVTASSGFYDTSDIRLKNVIETLESDNIKPIFFEWKDKRNEKKHWGYSAQDVMKWLPDAVDGSEDSQYNVNYNEVHTWKIAMLENRIKELEYKLN